MKKIRFGSFRPGESGARKGLGDLESDIMELIWLRDLSTVREVHGFLEQKRPIAYTTVMTVMGRLADKGILLRERDGKQYLYRPAISKDEFNESMFNSLLSDLGDNKVALLSYFVENVTTDKETLDELERLIKEKRQGLS